MSKSVQVWEGAGKIRKPKKESPQIWKVTVVYNGFIHVAQFTGFGFSMERQSYCPVITWLIWADAVRLRGLVQSHDEHIRKTYKPESTLTGGYCYKIRIERKPKS